MKKTLAPHFQGDSDFIEKIVQIEIPLPPVDELLLHRFVGENLANLCAGRDAAKAIEDFLHVESGAALRKIGLDEIGEKEPLFASLREAKRYLNAVETTLRLVLPDVHLLDFFALEYLRVFQPAVHEEVYRLRYSLTATITAGQENRGLRLDRFDSIMAAVTDEPRAKASLRLLAEVFPLFDAVVNKTNQFYGAYPLPGWAKELRARHPGFVDRYFRLEIPPDAVSRAEIRELFSAIVAQPQTRDQLIDEAIAKYRGQQRLLGFLEAIEMERGMLPVPLREELATALSARARELAQGVADKSMFDTSLPTLCHTLYRLLDKSGSIKQQTIAQSFVSNAPDLRFAVCFFYMATPSTDYRAPLEALDFAALHATMSARLVTTFVEQKADLIAELPHDWPLILRIWNNADVVTGVLVRLVRERPAYWSDVASLALETDFRQRRALVFKGLAKYTKIRALANAALSAPLESLAKERELITRFVSALRLVPELTAELRDVVTVADAVASSPMPKVTWSTPVWDRWSPLLKRWWQAADWWDRLERLYRDFQDLHAHAQTVGSAAGGTEAGAQMLVHHEEHVPLARSIAALGKELVPLVEPEIERLPFMPVDEDFNLEQ